MTRLSDSEWKIIELMWDRGPMSMMDVTRALADDTGWNKATVMTLMKRMESKGALSHFDGEKAMYFYPLIEKQDAALEETKTFLNKVYKGKIGLMISNLIKQEALSEEEIEELHRILKEGE